MMAETAHTVAFDTSNLILPGNDRGLGRYARAWLGAYRDIGCDLSEIRSSNVLSRERDLHKWYRSKVCHGNLGTYHTPSVYGLPVVKRCQWVCSVQDVIPLDLAVYRRFGVRAKLAFERARRCDHVIANSHYTASRVAEQMGIPTSYQSTIPLPVKEVFFDCNEEQNTGYVSAIVDLRTPDPRKRTHWIETLATSLRKANLQLRVTGRGLDSLNTGSEIVRVETKSDADLAAFLRSSTAYLYTSAYEGQGLPPLEAMACGVPVIAFSNTSITEMVGPGTNYLLVDPCPWETRSLAEDIPAATVDSVVSAALELATDGEVWETNSRMALQNSQRFTYKSFIENVRKFAEEKLCK